MKTYDGHLAPRGGPATTLLAHEFGMHEYPWPGLLGANRRKWEAVANCVTSAARFQHRRECTGSPDGRSRGIHEPFAGAHAEHHQSRIRLALVELLEAGIPNWLAASTPRAGEATVGNYEAAPPVPPLTDESTTAPVPVDSGGDSAASAVGFSAASTTDGSVANGRDLGGVSPLPSLSSRPVGAPSAAVDGTSSPNTDAPGCGPGTPVERAARSAQNGG